MPVTTSQWEPGRNPVHRLIQCLDVLAIVLNRFHQRSFRLPRQQEGKLIDPDGVTGWYEGRDRLLRDFEAVRDAVCSLEQWDAVGGFGQLLFDEAAGAFTRLGAWDQAVRTTVLDAAQWVGTVVRSPISVVGPTPRPWDYFSTKPEQPGHPRRGERFDAEGKMVLDAIHLRTALIHALVQAGGHVLNVIRARRRWISDPWQQVEPVTQAELLTLARETNPDSAAPAGSGQREGETPPAETNPVTPARIGDTSNLLALAHEIWSWYTQQGAWANLGTRLRQADGEELQALLAEDSGAAAFLAGRTLATWKDAAGVVRLDSPAFEEWEARVDAVHSTCIELLRTHRSPFRGGDPERGNELTRVMDALEKAGRGCGWPTVRKVGEPASPTAAPAGTVLAAEGAGGLTKPADKADGPGESPVPAEEANTEHLKAKLSGLPQRSRVAYLQYERAARDMIDPTDRAAYDAVKDTLPDGESLPGFDAWARYLREARSYLNQQKNKPRLRPNPAEVRSAAPADRR